MKPKFELLPKENILIQQPIHWKNYIGEFLLMGIAVVSAVFRAYYPDVSLINRVAGKTVIPEEWQPYLSAAEIVFLALCAFLAYVNIVRTWSVRYYVTDYRIISVEGILTVRFGEMVIRRCETVYLKQNLIERLFNSGDIICVSAGATVVLNDVYDARKFKQIILTIIAERNEKEETEAIEN